MHSPKKGDVKKTHRDLSPSSQEAEDEDSTIPALEVTAEANQEDVDYEPPEPVDIHELTQGEKPRRSSRPTKSQQNTYRRRFYPLTMTQMKLEQALRSKAPKEQQISSWVQVRRTTPRKENKTTPERHPRYQAKHKQKPTETEPASHMTGDQVLEISVQPQEEGERELDPHEL